MDFPSSISVHLSTVQRPKQLPRETCQECWAQAMKGLGILKESGPTKDIERPILYIHTHIMYIYIYIYPSFLTFTLSCPCLLLRQQSFAPADGHKANVDNALSDISNKGGNGTPAATSQGQKSKQLALSRLLSSRAGGLREKLESRRSHSLEGYRCILLFSLSL